MHLHELIPYTVIAFGAVLLLLAQFGRRFRAASVWFRAAFFLASCFSIAWSGLGFFLWSHQTGEHTDLPRSQFWALDHLKSYLTGVALGIFIALIISPEFWKRPVQRHQSSNQSLEPTAGRCDDHI
jgi:hypothetical protein